MSDRAKHDSMTACLRRRGCTGKDTQIVTAPSGNQQIDRLNLQLEDDGLVVAITKHLSGTTLVVTTRKIAYFADEHAITLPLRAIRDVRPNLYMTADKMYSMEVRSTDGSVLAIRTEPGPVFHALLDLLINFSDGATNEIPAEEIRNGARRLFDI
jgi:hypothetical protein